RHLIRHDEIAGQRQFQAASEADTVYRRDSYKWRTVDRSHYCMNAREEIADSGDLLCSRLILREAVSLAQVRAGTKPARLFAMDNRDTQFSVSAAQGGHELFQFLKRLDADFVARLTM